MLVWLNIDILTELEKQKGKWVGRSKDRLPQKTTETLPTNTGMRSGKSKLIWSLKANKKGLHKKMSSKRKTKESAGLLLRAGDLMKRDT